MSFAEYVENGFWPWQNLATDESDKHPFSAQGFEFSTTGERAEDAAEKIIRTVSAHFTNHGETPFSTEEIDECLRQITLIHLKHMFHLDQPWSPIQYLQEIKRVVLANDILATLLVFATEHESLLNRQNDEVEKVWARRLVTFSYVLSSITTACMEDESTLHAVFKAMKEMSESPEWINGLQRPAISGSLEAEFGKIKRDSVSLVKKPDAKSLLQQNPFANFALSMNISEAVLLDGIVRNRANARAGLSLVKSPNIFEIRDKRLRDKVLAKSQGAGYHLSLLPRNYADLYVSWNLCFACRQYGRYAPMHMTNLFNLAALSYVDSKSSTAFFVPRAISLTVYSHFGLSWYSVNNETYGIPDPDKRGFTNQRFVVQWAKLNEFYAKKFDEANQKLLDKFQDRTEGAIERPLTNTALTLKLLRLSLTSLVRDPSSRSLVKRLWALVHELDISGSIVDFSDDKGLTEAKIDEILSDAFGSSCCLQDIIASLAYKVIF